MRAAANTGAQCWSSITCCAFPPATQHSSLRPTPSSKPANPFTPLLLPCANSQEPRATLEWLMYLGLGGAAGEAAAALFEARAPLPRDPKSVV